MWGGLLQEVRCKDFSLNLARPVANGVPERAQAATRAVESG